MLPKSSLVYEDDYLAVIDKPTGVTVNRAETTKGQETVEDWFSDLDLPRHGLVHRLDKDTSGLLIIAKTAVALMALQAQFKQRQVRKTYLALVHGRVEPASGTINLPVGRNPLNRQRFMVMITGRPSLTEYRLMTGYREYSLLSVLPKTGRTHQIRVQFKHLNYPLVSDPLYLGKKRLKQDRVWCPRLFLHSHKLRLIHPVTAATINLEAPLPHDLLTALKTIPA